MKLEPLQELTSMNQLWWFWSIYIAPIGSHPIKSHPCDSYNKNDFIIDTWNVIIIMYSYLIMCAGIRQHSKEPNKPNSQYPIDSAIPIIKIVLLWAWNVINSIIILYLVVYVETKQPITVLVDKFHSRRIQFLSKSGSATQKIWEKQRKAQIMCLLFTMSWNNINAYTFHRIPSRGIFHVQTLSFVILLTCDTFTIIHSNTIHVSKGMKSCATKVLTNCEWNLNSLRLGLVFFFIGTFLLSLELLLKKPEFSGAVSNEDL